MPRYARARYARGRYAGPAAGGGSGGPAVAATLLGAVLAEFRSDPDLAAAFPTGGADPDPDTGVYGADAATIVTSGTNGGVPRCVVTMVGPGSPQDTTGRGRIVTRLVQFSVFDDDPVECERLTFLIQDKFHRNALLFANGYVMLAAAREPWPMPLQGGVGQLIGEYQWILEIDYMIGRTMSR